MKLSTKRLIYALIFMSVMGFYSPAQAYHFENTQTTIPLEVEGITLHGLFKAIEGKTDLVFMYDQSVENNTTLFNFSSSDISVTEILEQVTQKTGYTFKVINQTVYVKQPIDASNTSQGNKKVQQEDRIIEGQVIDQETKEPLIGASVYIKNTTKGVVTDFNGNFRIKVQGQVTTLVCSFISYKKQEISIEGKNKITIALQLDSKALQEVVVVGYGTQEAKDVTGAVGMVKEEDFNQGMINSPEQLLQGKMAGVNVVASSGEPGAAMNIVIRGASSIRSGNSPLYVIDGMPLDNSDVSPEGADMGVGSSQAKNPLNFLNPNDIASINILKDASATAIYGARGSNGVILITTKKGKEGKGTLSYAGSAGLSTLSKRVDVLETPAFITATDRIAEENGTENNYIYDRNVNTDWQKEMTRTAKTQNHNLSFSGGKDQSSYLASINYFDQEGIMKQSQQIRFSGRINVTQNFFEDRLKLGANLTASQVEDSGIPRSNGAGSGGELITNMLKSNPTYPTHDENGELFVFPSGVNPYAFLELYQDYTKTNRIIGNFNAEIQLLKGLSYKLNTGVDNATSNRNLQIDPNNIEFFSPDGRATILNVESENRLIENYFNYQLKTGRHNMKFLLGHSYQRFYRRTYGFTVNNLTTTEVDAINNPSIGSDLTSTPPTGSAQVNELQSFFGRVNYTFNEKYIFTASLRADGSSKFGDNNKYGIFPSFAAAWRLSEEPFIQNLGVFSNLKLRASWGQTGNQEIPNKITQASYSTSVSNGYWLNEGGEITNGITLARTANPDIKWEVNTQANIGVDFELFQGKLYGTFDYFNKKTTDLLLKMTSQDPSPSPYVWKNVDGTITNKGFEFSLGGHVITRGNFNWNVDANVTRIQNEINKLPLTLISTGSLSGPGLSGAQVNAYANGQPIGAFYLLEHLGFDEEGKNIFNDVDGDGTITNNDRVFAGSALPNYTLGLTNNLSYKNVDLSFSLNGSIGNKVYNNTANAYFSIPSLTNGNNITNAIASTNESSQNVPQPSTYYLEDANFLRLNYLTIGYKFNTSKWNNVSNLRIYATGQNLLTITNYSGFDPEVNTDKSSDGNLSYGIDYANYPRARTFILGVNVSF
ncbi:SusC/RagA family TonB-linked outer membrane protein [Flammeovirga aprica]|uniref:TonB-dependent receptor n=1 Tax=Flammeovirga aprica JL-4 TaxID=694437 RepID=A0A7X9P1X2_9BACT|nr:TonB-dependent receptor [Flammeovirga aprica]NME66897.1 TonB-dependent receptor [Flammeovirga aprica JL-4]